MIYVSIVRRDCEAGMRRLMNNLLPTAQSMLSKHREFYPYGGYIELGEDSRVARVSRLEETVFRF